MSIRHRVILSAFVALGLSACNQEAMTVNPDWIDQSPTPAPTTTTTPTPTPTPTSTGTPSPTPTGSDLYTGPADVEKYVLKFIDDAKAQGLDVMPELSNPKLQIQIAKLDQYGASVIGLCETGGIRRVTFDPDFWNSVSETQRELLAHHELGHCILYRPHLTSTLSTGAYASIMYPIIMSSSTYNNNYAYYQQELFSIHPSLALADANASTVHVCDQTELMGLR